MATTQPKTVALYGGAFDPPHKSHSAIVSQILNLPFIDEVWILPSGDRKDKKLVLNMHDRFDLLKKLIEPFGERVKVTDEEINLSKEMKRMIRTSELIPLFQQKHPECQFHFVIGGDILTTISNWEGWEYLMNEVNFIIFPRIGFDASEQPMPQKYILSDYIPEQISSSGIKNALLDEDMSKERKFQKVNHALEETTISLLQEKGLI